MASSGTITPDLLNSLLSADAQCRSQGEAFLQTLSVAQRVQGFLPIVIQANDNNNNNNNNNSTHGHLAAVLLRRDILRMTESPEALVDPLLQAFLTANTTASSTTTNRIAIGHCLAEIAGSVAMLAPSNQERVMNRILTAIGNAVGQGDIASLRLLTAMTERAPLVFATTAVPSLENLIQQVTFSNNNNHNNEQLLEALMQLLVHAAVATQATQQTILLPFTTGEENATIDPNSVAAALGRSCLPKLMQQWSSSSSETSSSSSSSLAMLQEWTLAASQCPSFLAGDKAVLEAVFGVCLAIANNNNNNCDDDGTTALAALDVVTTLSAVGDVKRKILTNDPALCQQILMGNGTQQGAVALLAQWMTVGMDEDAQAWASEPASLLEEDPWDGDDTAQHAESLLQSLLHSLPAPTLAVALPLVEQQLQPSHTDWRRHCAGLAMMEACAQKIAFASHVPVAVNAAVSMASSTQPIRVQWQAVRLLGVLCETEISTIVKMMQQNYAVQVLQTLAQAVQSPCSKVATMSCLAIVSFARMSQEEGNPVVAFLSDLLQALNGPLSNPSLDRGATVVKIRAVGAVAALAQSSGEAFAPFYATVMPCLLACSRVQPVGHEACQLIGASIEAATIVGQAVASDESTRNQYVRSAGELMQFIVPILQNADIVSSDMPIDQILSACARIASVMDVDYIPFLHAVVPHLIQRAVAPPDVSVTEGDEAGLNATKRQQLEIDEDGTESMTVAVPGKGVKKFTVNTSQIETKAQAARAIYEHAVALSTNKGFQPYVLPCLEAFTPLVNFKFSPEVRATSALAVGKLWEAGCLYADETGDSSQLLPCFPTLVKAVANQIKVEDTDDHDAMFAICDALSELFYSMHQRKEGYFQHATSVYTLADATEVVGIAMAAISACLKRRSNVYRVLSGQEGTLTGEDEQEECHAQLRQEEQLLTPLVDSVGYTLKLFKEQFMPVFEKFVAPVLGPALTNGDIRAKLAAVCLYDDVVEHCGPEAAAVHSQKLVYGIILGIDEQTNGNDSELQSASLYGISQIVRHAPSSVLAPHLESICQNLLKVLKASSKDESDNPMCYENAVSALASMTLIGKAPFAASAPVSRDELLNIFVNNLPLREDPDEAKICHEAVVELIETGSLDVTTTNVASILRVLGETIAFAEDEDIADQETRLRMAQALAKMFQTLPTAVTNAAFSTLSEEAKLGIQMAIN